jgi:hypothetical protein
LKRVLTKAVAFIILSTAPLIGLAGTRAKVGVDYWKIKEPETQTRYFPNYAPTEPWKSTSAWIAVNSSDYLSPQVSYSIQAQHHEVDGVYVSRAYLDWRVSGLTGARVGVLPYRMSNCQQYGDKSVWIKETDALCKYPGLNEISQGSFGVQVYGSSVVKNWVVDYSIGAFAPKVDGQDTKLGPYKKVGETLSHDKVVASVSGVHLPSGVEIKAGVSFTDMSQRDDRPVASPYTRHLKYTSWFLSGEGYLTSKWTVSVSGSGYIGEQLHPRSLYSFNATNLSAETSYRVTPRDRVSVGVGKYANITTYAGSINKQVLEVPSTTVSWRHSFDKGMQLKVQYMEGSDDYLTRSLTRTYSKNRALGVQVSYSF